MLEGGLASLCCVLLARELEDVNVSLGHGTPMGVLNHILGVVT